MNDKAPKVVLPVAPSWRTTLKSWLLAASAVFTYTPIAFLLGRIVWISAPAPRSRSSFNNLIFPFASDRSPLRAVGRYPVKITAGVLPKRFHAHNDCMNTLHRAEA
jgi:hypothetical protein